MKQIKKNYQVLLFLILSVLSLGNIQASPGGVSGGLRLWLDASDTSTMHTDTGCSPGSTITTKGETVRCWKDKSPQGYEAIAASGAPVWIDDGGLDALEFTSDRLEIEGSAGGAVFDTGVQVSETEVFFVARTRTIANGWAFGYINAGRRFGSHFPWGNGDVFFDVGVCCGASRINAPWGGSSDFLHTWNFVSDDGTPNYQAIYRDGTLVASDGVADFVNWGTSDFHIGAYNNSFQQINAAEFIIYDRRLTETERDQVKNYLLNKWKKPIAASDGWISGTNRAITEPSGTDRMLVVAVGYEDNVNNSITSVSYGGQTLTEVDQITTGTSFFAGSSLWYLNDTEISASVGTTITTTFSNGNPIHTDVASAVYTGIDQFNPVYSSTVADDGQSGLPELESELAVSQSGLTVITAQNGNTGNWGTNLSTVVNHSGNSTSQVVGVSLETQENLNRIVSVNHSNNFRTALAGVHFRSNVLPVVTDLQALASSDTSINLTWDIKDSVPNYRIAYQEGSTAPGNCEQGTLIDVGNDDNFQVTGLSVSTEYSFRVCANSGSLFTNGIVASAITDFIAPDPANELLGVSVEVNGGDSADFSWVSGGGGTIGFRLAFSTGLTPPSDCLSATQIDLGSTTTYTLNSLSPSTDYSYRICAYNGTPSYTPGLTGSFATPGISSLSTEVHIASPWQIGTTRTEFGNGQNRALVFVIGYEGGSDISGATFGGQNLTQIENRNFVNARTEMWALNESQIQALNSSTTISLTFNGGAPLLTTYSSVVLGNVDQPLITSDTANVGITNTNSTLTLNTENGGLSIVGSTTRRNNGVGTINTAGWETGISAAISRHGFISTHRESTANGSDSVNIGFNGNGQISTIGAHFMLADPSSPLGLQTISKSDTTINIEWTSGLGSTTGFRLAFAPGATAPANCLGAIDIGDVSNYSITGLTPDTEYGIRLCAYNVQGDLETGIVLIDTTAENAPLPPTEINNLNLSVVSDSKLSLNWTSGGGSTESFIVAYLAGATAPADCSLGTTQNIGTPTAFQINGLLPNTQYSFRVCAVNADNVMSAGLTISGTTQDSSTASAASTAGTWQTGLTRTIDPGNNRALIFVVSSEDSVDADVSAVTYGGQNLIQAESSLSSFVTNQFNRVEIWYLLESQIQAASGSDFDVTWSAGVLNRRYYSHIVLEGVDQTSPIHDNKSYIFTNGSNPIEGAIDHLTGGLSILGATTSQNGTYNFNNGWSFGSNQQGNSSTLGTANITALTNGTELSNSNHTNAGRSALAIVHFKQAEADPNNLLSLTGSALNSSTIRLDWTSGGGTTTGFRIAYLEGGAAPVDCLSGIQLDAGNVSTRQISGLNVSTQYSFRVCAYNSSSIYSAGRTVSVTTSTPATNWTGAISSDWFNPGNWSDGVPSSTVDCIIEDLAIDPRIDGNQGNAQCQNITLRAPLGIDGSVTPVELAIFGQTLIEGAAVINETNGTFTIRDSSSVPQSITSSSDIPRLKLAKTSGGNLNFNSNINTNNLTYEGTSNLKININSGMRFNINNDFNIPNNIELEIKQGGVLNIASGSTLSVDGGVLKANAIIDDTLIENPGYNTSQAHIGTISGSGSFDFEATSGEIDFRGIYINRLSTNGIQILGSTIVASFEGVHLTNTQIGPSGQAVLFNSTGTYPASMSYLGFDFENKADYATNTGYQLINAPGNCGPTNHTITLLEWDGNFMDLGIPQRFIDNPPVCNIIMDLAASPISLADVVVFPFSDAIVLEWRTSAEVSHKGFNLYRSESPSSGFIQINDEIILNSIFSLGYAGEYRYIDRGVEEGKTYYYLLEDISIFDDKVQHGPYEASLDPLVGTTPNYTDGLNEYNGNNDFQGSLASDLNNSVTNIAPGVNSYQLPNGKLRIHIKPPTYNSSDANWDSSYKDITISSYVNLSEAGRPALPFTEVLIPLPSSATNITSSFENADITTATELVSPAPSYNVVGTDLVPSYFADALIYASPALFPSTEHIKVEEESISIDGLNYIKLKLFPVLFQGDNSEVTILNEVYVDISYDEAQVKSPSVANHIEFNSIAKNGVRIFYEKAGHYEISFDDLFQSGLETLFEGIPHSQLELNYKGKPLSLYIDRENEEFFGPGDRLIFYAPFESSIYNTHDTVYLSIDPESNGLRYLPVHNYQELELDEIIFEKKLSYEVNNYFSNRISLGDNKDHYFWKRMILESGDSSFPADATHCEFVDMDGYTGGDINISLNAYSFSNPGIVTDIEVQAYFTSDESNKADITIKADQGLNTGSTIYFADFEPDDSEELCFAIKPFSRGSQEYNILHFNNFSISYNATATEQTKQFKNLWFATNYEVPIDPSRGDFLFFQNEPEGDSYIYKNLQRSENFFEFMTQGIVSSESLFEVVYVNELKKPSTMVWTQIEGEKLDSIASSDLLIITNKALLDQAEALANHKESMGLSTSIVTQQWIFDHYSFGRTTPFGIKGFLKSINDYSEKNLKYVIFALDASQDARNFENLEETTRTPSHLSASLYMDYASDNWFAYDDNGFYDFALGRLPANNELELKGIINKIIEYETNQVDTFSNDISFLYTTDPVSNFEGATNSFSAKASNFTKKFTNVEVAGAGALTNEFDNNFLVNYIGHGDEYEIGSSANAYLDIDDVQNLENNTYPILMTLNCLSNYFDSADPTDKGLSELLLLKEDAGAVGVISSNALLSPVNQSLFATYFYDELNRVSLNGDQTVKLGDLVKYTHMRLNESNLSNRETESIFLLGDPSLKLPPSTFQVVAKSSGSATPTGLGCSAFANGKQGQQKPWAEGILELLFLLILGRCLKVGMRRFS